MILQLVDLTLELNLTDKTSKDEKMINKKILPACLLLPLMLTGCDDINSFLADLLLHGMQDMTQVILLHIHTAKIHKMLLQMTQRLKR